jgi:hypothetical protein
MRNVVSSIEAEFRKYKKLGEIAIGQLTDDEIAAPAAEGGNTVASLVWHLSGNLKSRFTDFLTTDGEKPWRNKEEEFRHRRVTHDELLERWNDGWATLFQSLEQLQDVHLDNVVMIVGKAHRIDEALHRALAHASYHVGQIVFIAKTRRAGSWKSSKSFGETK